MGIRRTITMLRSGCELLSLSNREGRRGFTEPDQDASRREDGRIERQPAIICQGLGSVVRDIAKLAVWARELGLQPQILWSLRLCCRTEDHALR